MPPLREWTHAAPVTLLSAIPPAMAVLPSAESATEKPCSGRQHDDAERPFERGRPCDRRQPGPKPAIVTVRTTR
jgi:hypothetical protein